MKNFIPIITLVLFSMISNITNAQSSDPGTFWVLETQKGIKYSQIKIYDQQLNLIYNHELFGKRLNSLKKKHKKYIEMVHSRILAGHQPHIWKYQKSELIKP
ncbi:hypothetical protein EF405_06535 [Cyclobacteriaceae bacterium YHN15]|nr:hypothetical protein EF405_06535 [Cyclobacteriaceae bacterium YHN15]